MKNKRFFARLYILVFGVLLIYIFFNFIVKTSPTIKISFPLIYLVIFGGIFSSIFSNKKYKNYTKEPKAFIKRNQSNEPLISPINEKDKTKKQANPILKVLGFLILMFCVGGGVELVGKAFDTKPKNLNEKEDYCSGYGDEQFITSKLSEMNCTIVHFEEQSHRKYNIIYFNMSTGKNTQTTLDYTNNPCND
jgi:hypothetical protein